MTLDSLIEIQSLDLKQHILDANVPFSTIIQIDKRLLRCRYGSLGVIKSSGKMETYKSHASFLSLPLKGGSLRNQTIPVRVNHTSQ